MSAVYILVALVAYLIGSINFAIIFSKKFAGFDVREKGSKNAGTTNVLRTVGKGAAALTLICDILKGVVAVLIAMLAANIWKDTDTVVLKYLAGLFAIIGHTFPVYYGFKGGKGVATSLGVLLIVNPQIGIICLSFALIIMIATRWVSLGSILAATLFPILTIFMTDNFGGKVISILIGVLVIFNHRTNIKRLKDGTENKLSFKK
jgi:glycerol-3-phosphate acyltransferase PlsY